jgi:hypothetical protein
VRLAAEPCDEQRQRERGDVGQHVACIGEQRERVRQDAADALGDEERGGERERDPQTANLVARRAVRMIVVVVVARVIVAMRDGASLE